jgi:hypothetical protein
MPNVARSWLQAPFKAPAACTIRLAIASGGGNHDWSITAGTRWASLDGLVDAWNTALAGAATVAITPDLELHQAQVTITTGTGATYSITWSQSGDGTAVRDRLGATGNVVAATSGAVGWPGVCVGAFYSWVGFGRVVRGRTHIFGGSAARTMDGTIVSQHSRDTGDDPVEMDVTLRWGAQPGTGGSFLGHLALEQFLEDLYSSTTTPCDTMALYHEAGADTPERWLVRLADDRLHLRPICTVQPHVIFELELSVDVVEAPL